MAMAFSKARFADEIANHGFAVHCGKNPVQFAREFAAARFANALGGAGEDGLGMVDHRLVSYLRGDGLHKYHEHSE